MSVELLSPLLVTACALVFVVLERVLPYDRGRRVIRNGFWNDLAMYGIVQSYLLGWAIFGLLHAVDGITGTARNGFLTQWPVGMQVAFSLVTHDLYIYWFHRMQHRFAWLWRLHEAHHSTNDVDWLSGVRSHPLEILINQTVEFAPLVLFGAAPETILVKGIIDAVWGMYIHSNVDVRSGRLQRIINGPEMHRWHHARDVEAHNRNFATKFAVWDWLFGTAFLPARRKPGGYGLGEDAYPQGHAYPQGYLGQFIAAFRRGTPEP